MKTLSIPQSIKEYTIIMNILIKKNQFEEVEKLIEIIKERDISKEYDTVFYSTMLRYYTKKRNLSFFLNLIEEMRQKNVVPDILVYTEIIKSYLYFNRIEEALNIYENIFKESGKNKYKKKISSPTR
jgi:pentatricopeptide repeat protein